jgi:MerR family mercuric resistance operon transcriptional regulator
MDARMTIARLAEAAEVHVETIRYYQRRGLIRAPERQVGSIRRYGEDDVQRLRFIKRAQSVGFTLDEVASLLSMRSRICCSATRSLAAAKLEAIDQRLLELTRLRIELASWIADCDANAVDQQCPVMDRLEARTSDG